MALRYILGGINSGKTFTCINEIIQSADNKDKTILYIVPEQFSMQSQKNILSGMKNCVSMNIRVSVLNILPTTYFQNVVQ